MKNLLTVVIVAFILVLSHNLAAKTLVVDVDGTGLEVTGWDAREVSTRSWPGCKAYDVLQGTGWFPMTWHYDYTPEIIEQDLYSFETSKGFWRWYCRAEMDEWNYVQLNLDLGAGESFQGRFRVVPGGESDETVVSCTVRENVEPMNAIVCEDAVVSLIESKEIYVTVELR